MDTWAQRREVFVSNMALVQCQAIVVASIAVLVTLLSQFFKGEQVSLLPGVCRSPWRAVWVLF